MKNQSLCVLLVLFHRLCRVIRIAARAKTTENNYYYYYYLQDDDDHCGGLLTRVRLWMKTLCERTLRLRRRRRDTRSLPRVSNSAIAKP